jgi:cullin 1
MGILLQFNNATTHSWEELVASTGLNADVLVGQMGSLVKGKVLSIEGGALGADGTKYSLNMDFKSKKIRINFNVPIKSEQKTESDETHKTIEEDRKLLIQAAIVRIMK